MWICSQIHAREHYAIPRALHAAGKLRLLLTDIYCPPRHPLRLLAPSMAGRYHSGLTDAAIISWSVPALVREWHRRRTKSRYDGFAAYGKWFSRESARTVAEHGDMLHGCHVFFSYDTGFLEAARYLKQQGLRCVVGQMDPGETEQQIVEQENNRWPGWALQEARASEAYNLRRRMEWDVADVVLVNSKWSAAGLQQQGVPEEKIHIIPLCYEPDTTDNKPRQLRTFTAQNPLRVLFLGQVVLRKGVQYLIDAARKLEGVHVHFDVVGPLKITREAISTAPKNVTFHGRCTRMEAHKHYRGADLFLLPTLSDGFALTQLEAMAHGLPVIATPNCGEVVTPGVDGRIIAAMDSEAIVEAISATVRNPAWLAQASEEAIRTGGRFGIGALQNALLKLETQLASLTHERPDAARTHGGN